MDWTTPTLLKIAFCEFLISIDPLLPGYWYSLWGDGLGSIAYLLGVSPNVLEVILLKADILKRHGKKEVRFMKDVFESGFALLDGLERPKSVEHTVTNLYESTKQKTQSTKKRSKHQHFICIGSSTSARTWATMNVQTQKKKGLSPP